MKLPDFSTDPLWNSLRRMMRAEYIEVSNAEWSAFDSTNLLDRLRQGIEVDLAEVDVSGDGTFDYKGIKVLVYIKDQIYYPDKEGEYRFHICSCSTIEEFRKNGRLDRYVVSTKTTGEFVVNIYNRTARTYVQKDVIRKLSVCKNCLAKLSYKGYTSYYKTPTIYDTFSIDEFFNLYGYSKFQYLPNKTSDNAPLNEYSSDFGIISEQIRRSRNWRCERCSLLLESNKRYLHVHHKNGLKWDNDPANLQCLCIGCHAEEPNHGRLKISDDYNSFMSIYEETWMSCRKSL